MQENICFSGGALGSDIEWGNAAEKAGHKIVHYSFAGHETRGLNNVVKLTQQQLNRADGDLLLASKFLRRSTGKSLFIKNLLRRNWWQIINTHSVYGISTIDSADKSRCKIAGGTAWAVELAIIKAVPLIYVFDQGKNQWYQWNYTINHWADCGIGLVPPQPIGFWTGIGTRDLNRYGKEAIKNCFKENHE